MNTYVNNKSIKKIDIQTFKAMANNDIINTTKWLNKLEKKKQIKKKLHSYSFCYALDSQSYEFLVQIKVVTKWKELKQALKAYL